MDSLTPEEVREPKTNTRLAYNTSAILLHNLMPGNIDSFWVMGTMTQSPKKVYPSP